jgi:hypothetical protein
MVALVKVMAVVSGDELEVMFSSEIDESAVNYFLFGQAGVDKFQEEVIASEEVEELIYASVGQFFITLENWLRYRAFEASGESDEAVGVILEGFEIDARFIIEAFEESDGGEFGEVNVAVIIFSEEYEVLEVFLVGEVFIETRVGSEIDFGADDGFEIVLSSSLIEIDCAEEVSVVGDGDSWGAKGGDFFAERGNAAGAIEQAKFRVDVEMNKKFMSHE